MAEKLQSLAQTRFRTELSEYFDTDSQRFIARSDLFKEELRSVTDFVPAERIEEVVEIFNAHFAFIDLVMEAFPVELKDILLQNTLLKATIGNVAASDAEDLFSRFQEEIAALRQDLTLAKLKRDLDERRRLLRSPEPAFLTDFLKCLPGQPTMALEDQIAAHRLILSQVDQELKKRLAQIQYQKYVMGWLQWQGSDSSEFLIKSATFQSSLANLSAADSGKDFTGYFNQYSETIVIELQRSKALDERQAAFRNALNLSFPHKFYEYPELVHLFDTQLALILEDTPDEVITEMAECLGTEMTRLKTLKDAALHQELVDRMGDGFILSAETCRLAESRSILYCSHCRYYARQGATLSMMKNHGCGAKYWRQLGTT